MTNGKESQVSAPNSGHRDHDNCDDGYDSKGTDQLGRPMTAEENPLDNCRGFRIWRSMTAAEGVTGLVS